MSRARIVVLGLAGAGVLLAAALALWVLPARAAVTLPTGSPQQALAWSADGRQLAAGGNDGLVRVWDVGTWKLVATLDTQCFFVHCLAFSPDGRLLAAGNPNGLHGTPSTTASGAWPSAPTGNGSRPAGLTAACGCGRFRAPEAREARAGAAEQVCSDAST